MKLRLQLVDETGKLWDSYDVSEPPPVETLSGKQIGTCDQLCVQWAYSRSSMLFGGAGTLDLPAACEREA